MPSRRRSWPNWSPTLPRIYEMAREQSKCRCWCHAPPDGIWFPIGVDTCDVIEAAAACDHCKACHVDALRSTILANAPDPPAVDTEAWVDPPISTNSAEGDDGE